MRQTLFFRTGTITTAGVQLHKIDLKWWRSQIGLVQQEPFLFNDTIFKNVEYGLIGTEWEDETEEKKRELVEYACKEAFADEFITRLPDVRPLSCGLVQATNKSRDMTLNAATLESNSVVANARDLPSHAVS